MRLQNLLLLMGSVVVLTFAATLLVWTVVHLPASPDATQSVPYVFYVNDSWGFDVDTDALRMGAVRPGGSSKRGLSVAASGDRARIVFIGDGSEMLSAEPSWADIVNGTTSFQVRLAAPLDADFGRYEGVARVEIYSVNH